MDEWAGGFAEHGPSKQKLLPNDSLISRGEWKGGEDRDNDINKMYHMRSAGRAAAAVAVPNPFDHHL